MLSAGTNLFALQCSCIPLRVLVRAYPRLRVLRNRGVAQLLSRNVLRKRRVTAEVKDLPPVEEVQLLLGDIQLKVASHGCGDIDDELAVLATERATRLI